MTEAKVGLEDLKSAVENTMSNSTNAGTVSAASSSPESALDNVVSYEPQIDSLGRAYATGRRKDATARVWIKAGSGKMTVNGRDYNSYFARPVLQMILRQPFEIVGRENQFDVICTVRGGGLSGQAGAVKHGISRALVNYDPDTRADLKVAGQLTRDSRVVERKKYGKRKARRSFQFSKR